MRRTFVVQSIFLSCLVFLFLVPNHATAQRPGADPPDEAGLLGDWVGWAYLDEGGDVPLRLRISRGAEGLNVRFDELVWKRYDLPAELSWREQHLVVTRQRPSGTRIVLDGALEGEVFRGRLTWGSAEGEFDLSRSRQTISRMAPETFEDLEGVYRLSPDRSLVVSSRFWGELLVTDLASGRYATLFPVDADRFFVGSALYVPGPIHAWLEFERNDDDVVASVTWSEVGESAVSGPRTPIIEEEIGFQSDGIRLVGTLLRPEGPGPFPAAVVLPGSDWSERAAGRRDATTLAAFGMAAFIYDKRGSGESGGEPVVSFRQTARDAAAALARLADRADVLSDQVGFTGRSRGGWFAPLAATLAPDAAFVVLFVPPAVSPASQETTRRLNLLRDGGFSSQQIETARRMLREAWRYADTGEGWEAYAASRKRAVAAELPEEIFEPADSADVEWDWTRLNMAYDPIPALEALRLPVLALFGEHDRNVVVAENLPAMRGALERGGNPDFELFVVRGANHGLRASGDPNLPMHQQVGFGSAGWKRVVGWLGDRLDLAEPAKIRTAPMREGP